MRNHWRSVLRRTMASIAHNYPISLSRNTFISLSFIQCPTIIHSHTASVFSYDHSFLFTNTTNKHTLTAKGYTYELRLRIYASSAVESTNNAHYQRILDDWRERTFSKQLLPKRIPLEPIETSTSLSSKHPYSQGQRFPCSRNCASPLWIESVKEDLQITNTFWIHFASSTRWSYNQNASYHREHRHQEWWNGDWVSLLINSSFRLLSNMVTKPSAAVKYPRFTDWSWGRSR